MVEIGGVYKETEVSATDIYGYASSRDLDIFKKEEDFLPISTSSIKQSIMKFWQGEVLWDCSMKKLSTLRVGGPATAVVFPSSEEDIVLLIRGLQQNNIPWRVIGKGSNILVPDEGFSGVVIVFGSRFSKINKIDSQGEKEEVHIDAERRQIGRLLLAKHQHRVVSKPRPSVTRSWPSISSPVTRPRRPVAGSTARTSTSPGGST